MTQTKNNPVAENSIEASEASTKLTDAQLNEVAGGSVWSGIGHFALGLAEGISGVVTTGESLGLLTPIGVSEIAHGGYEMAKGVDEIFNDGKGGL
ncbi:MAG: hypothetical protein QJR07_11280 [Acetobacteraceae bacterium]|nr:hypothetical protein [Acetobacteraceae bacterium]